MASSHEKFRKSSRISRFTLVGPMRSQPELLRRTFFHKERSVAISCLPHRPLLFHWTRTPKQNVQPEFNRISETSLPDSCSTRPMFCFEICGCVQTWHRVTEV